MFSREGQGHGLGRYNWEYFSLRYICFALGRCPPFFVEHICAAFSGQCFVPGIDVVLFAPVCVLYLHACLHIDRPIPASPDTPTGAANTSGVVFHHSESFKFFLWHTPLGFSLCRLLLVGSSSNSLACLVIIQSVLFVAWYVTAPCGRGSG